MRSTIWSLLLLVCAVLVVILFPVSTTVAKAQSHPSLVGLAAEQAQSLPPLANSELVPLGRSCGGGLPPGHQSAACCMFGYIFIDGKPVEGAKVTITSSRTAHVPSDFVEVWTMRRPDALDPYYQVNLSGSPWEVQPGEVITITAEYSNRTQTITHTVLGGGQQIDLVLPRQHAHDFVFEPIATPPSPAGRFAAPSGVAIGGDGRVYVVDASNNRLQVFNQQGQLLQQWGTFGGAPGQFAAPAGVAVDRQGRVLVVDTGNQRVQVFSATGTWLASWGGYDPVHSKDRFDEPVGIAIDRDGYVYVTDTDDTYVHKFTGDGVRVTSWSFPKRQGDHISLIGGIATSTNGSIYVADAGNHRVHQFTSDGTWVREWGGLGVLPGQFQAPTALAVDQSGLVYVVDAGNRRVQVFDQHGQFLRLLGDAGDTGGLLSLPVGIAIDATGQALVTDLFQQRVHRFLPDGSPAGGWGEALITGREYSSPAGVAVTAQGDLYVADRESARVYKRTAAGTWLSDWSDAVAFADPVGVAVDSAGAVYISDMATHTVHKLDPTGAPLAVWGGPGVGEGQLFKPAGLAVAADGSVYVADSGNHRVQRFDANGQFQEQIGTYGDQPGQLKQPLGIAIDKAGALIIADSGNRRVQRITADGTAMLWRRPGGPNREAMLPVGVAVDQQGRMYVADQNNERIHRFNHRGRWEASWGEKGLGLGKLQNPFGIAVDRAGDLYITDPYNFYLQRLRTQRSTTPIATIVATGLRSVVQGEPITVQGLGADGDTTAGVIAYEWSLNAQQLLVTTPTTVIDTTALTPGRHTLSLQVVDEEGERSSVQSVEIAIRAPSTSPLDTWTMLLYLDGDTANGDLARYLAPDSAEGALYRLQQNGAGQNVPVIALYDGPGSGDSARYTLRDGHMSVEPLGEVNMGDPATLVNFVRTSQQQAPADHFYLALADHADPLSGLLWDTTSAADEYLTFAELRQALTLITQQGAEPIDLLHLDACSLATLETAYQLRGVADYLVASQSLAWSAFAYEYYRSAIDQHTSPAELARAVVDSYAERLDGATIGPNVPPYTISALDLSRVPELVTITDALAGELQRYALADPTARTEIGTLIAEVQRVDTDGTVTIDPADTFVDLGDWAHLVQTRVANPVAQELAAQLMTALETTVMVERHRSGFFQATPVSLDNVRGLSIYYPAQHTPQLYERYLKQDLMLPQETQWDELLATLLNAKPLDPASSDPQPVTPLPEGAGTTESRNPMY